MTREPTDEEIEALLQRRPFHQPNPPACNCGRCVAKREMYRRLFDLVAYIHRSTESEKKEEPKP
jgi:hypothetical protein